MAVAAVIETRRAVPADVDHGAEVLAEAFSDYPWTRWTVDAVDHRSRIAGLQRLSIRNFGFAEGGHVWVTTVEGSIVCVALWSDSDFTAESAEDELLAQLEGSRHPASLAAEREIADWRPTQRHLFLGAVGTLPKVQQHGFGAQTLAPMLAIADETRTLAFLETSTLANLSFYASLGFEVVAHRRITGVGAPEVWAMIRSAR